MSSQVNVVEPLDITSEVWRERFWFASCEVGLNVRITNESGPWEFSETWHKEINTRDLNHSPAVLALRAGIFFRKNGQSYYKYRITESEPRARQQ